MCDNRRVQTLENHIAAQARMIELLSAKGVLGFLQRLRLRKYTKNLPEYLKEDGLRNENFRLKEKLHGYAVEAGKRSQHPN